MKLRQKKLSRLLQEEIAIFLQKEFSIQLGIITVCFVGLSDDLKLASVYVSSLNTNTEEEKNHLVGVLQRKAFVFQREFAKKHSIKFIPQITFFYDSGRDRVDEVDKLLDIISHEQK